MLRGYNTALQKKTWGGAGAPGLEHKSAVHTDKVNHILVYMSKHGASRTKEVYTENRKKKKKSLFCSPDLIWSSMSSFELSITRKTLT